MLEARVNELFEEKQRVAHASDAIIFGLPNNTACLRSAFNQVCNYIGFLPPRLKDIFRPKHQSGAASPVVIAKFYTQSDRNRTLKAFSEFRLRKKTAVNLRAAGIECDNFFYIHESIDEPTRILLQKAIMLKKDKKLHNAFTFRGIVHVRRERNSSAIAVKCEQDLEAITANYTEHANENNTENASEPDQENTSVL